jgi:hypothetical protein
MIRLPGARSGPLSFGTQTPLHVFEQQSLLLVQLSPFCASVHAPPPPPSGTS